MKKISLAIVCIASMLYSSPLSSSVSGGFNPLTKSSAKTSDAEKKDNYNELVSFLSKSPSGEYAMSLAIIYLNGIEEPDAYGNTIKPNIKKTIFYLKKSSDLNYFKSDFILGSLYYNDHRFKELDNSQKLAKKFLLKAFKNKIYESALPLSGYYFYTEKNPKKAIEILHQGAKNNDSSSQLALATTYGYGSPDAGIKQNKFLGNKFLGEACSNENKTRYVTKFCNSAYILNKKGGE